MERKVELPPKVIVKPEDRNLMLRLYQEPTVAGEVIYEAGDRHSSLRVHPLERSRATEGIEILRWDTTPGERDAEIHLLVMNNGEVVANEPMSSDLPKLVTSVVRDIRLLAKELL